MKSYESMFIIAPTVAPEAYDRLIAGFEEVITNGGGSVSNTIKWGRRNLAYEVKKFKEGMYTIFEFEAPNDLVKELERRYKLNDSVLKFMTVKNDRKDKLVSKGSARRKKKQDHKAKRKAAKSSGDYRQREDV